MSGRQAAGRARVCLEPDRSAGSKQDDEGSVHVPGCDQDPQF